MSNQWREDTRFFSFNILFNNYKNYFKVNDTPSLPLEQNIPPNVKKTRGKREEPLPGSSSFGSREGEGVESATINNIPLENIPGYVKKPIDDLRIHIDKKTMKHFSKLMISVQRINHRKKTDQQFNEFRKRYFQIFNKIEDHFNVEYNKFGKAWPEVYIDANKTIPASFGFHMTKGGYLELQMNRGTVKKVGIKKIVQEIYKVFSFLGHEDWEQLLSFFQLYKRNDNVFVHLANKLSDDTNGETIEEKLKGAILKVNYVDFYGEDVIHIKVDYSNGPEIEIEGEESTSLNLNTIIVEPAKAARTLRGVAANVEELMDIFYMYLMKGLDDSHKLIIKNGEVLVSIQEELRQNHQETLAFVSEIDMNNRNEHLQRQIEHKDIDNKIIRNGKTLQIIQQDIRTIDQKIVPGIKDEISYYYNETNKNQLKTTEALIGLSHNTRKVSENVGKLTETQIVVKDEIQDKIEKSHKFTNELIIDTTNQIKDHVSEGFQRLEDNFKSILKQEFKEKRDSFQDNLNILLRELHLLPGLTSKEITSIIQEERSISRSTIYNYLVELQNCHLIKKEKIKKDGPGRPSFIFSLSEKTRNLIKKLKKQ